MRLTYSFLSGPYDMLFLKRFFQTTRVVIVLRRRCEAPLNLQMTTTLLRVTLFCIPQRQSQKPRCNVHFTHNYTVDFCGLFCKQERIQPGSRTDKNTAQESWLGKCKRSAAMPRTKPGWNFGWVAPCTVVCKMQAAQSLMAQSSPIIQQSDSFT